MILMFIICFYSYAQQEITIKSGTQISFQSVNSVKAADAKVGQKLLFIVSRDIIVDGKIAIPYGTLVDGNVVNAKKSSWFGTKGRLAMSINEIVMPDGTIIPIHNGDFEITGENRRV